ncbi:MAG: spondin domain-containing protein [Halobacterium sp.]
MSRDRTRRSFVIGTAAASVAAIAGCTGGDGSGSGGTTTDSMDDMGTTEEMMGTTEESMETEDGMDGTTSDGMMSASFTVRVENVSDSETLETMDGSVAVPLSPTAYAVHEGESPLFSAGEDASGALEKLAEDGMAGDLASEAAMDAATADAVAVPAGSDEAGPIGPGGHYEFTVEASQGHHLSLATMFVQSNDLFYAPSEDGIPLFQDGEPVDGDVTDQLTLWDAGTEQNQAPGEGGEQAPRQMEAGAGTMEDATVRHVMDVDDGYEYPATSDVIRVTVSPGSMDG